MVFGTGQSTRYDELSRYNLIYLLPYRMQLPERPSASRSAAVFYKRRITADCLKMRAFSVYKLPHSSYFNYQVTFLYQNPKFTKPEDARHLVVDSQVIAAIPAVIDCIDRRLIPTVESRGNNAQGFPRSQYYGNI